MTQWTASVFERRSVRPLAIGLTLVALLTAGRTGSADGPPPNRTPAAHESVVSLFENAVRIGDHGIRSRDPVSLIAAARIIRSIGGRYRADAVRHGRNDPATAKPADDIASRSTEYPRSPDERFLSEAESLAGGDKAILSLIERTVASSTRGREDGPGRWQGRVGEHGYVDLDVAFTGSELAEVVAVGDGESDIDLLVLDSRGNVICKSARKHDRESCRWIPNHSERFTVRVVNYGAVWNFVTIVTN